MGTFITIIIPTYNRDSVTTEAIDSVTTVNPSLVEIIVVDDSSAQPYSYPHKSNIAGIPVRIFRHEVNTGAAVARQTAANHATGEYLAFLDSDDRYQPGWVDFVLSSLMSPSLAKKKVFVSGLAVGGKSFSSILRLFFSKSRFFCNIQFFRFLSIFFNPFYTPTIVLHRDVCRFTNRSRYCEDFYTSVHGLALSDVLLLPAVGACILGRHPNTSGGLSGHRIRMIFGELRIRRALAGSGELSVLVRLATPLGVVYQVIREVVKSILILFRAI